jgi:uncharacterized protein (TIGR03663 family)
MVSNPQPRGEFDVTTPGSDRDVAQTPPAETITARESARLNDDVLQARIRSPFTGFGLVVTIILLMAAAFRFLKLDAYLMGEGEARWATYGWSIYTGSPLPASGQLPDDAPVLQLASAITFALFGVTDAIARIAPAVFGLGIVVLVFAMRPFLSRSHLASMSLLAAISPTLVYASRTVDPGIAAAFFALLTVVALLRAGSAGTSLTQAGWALCVGLGLAGMLGSGVDGVTSFVALAVGIFVAAVTDASGQRDGKPGAVRHGVASIATSATNVGLLLVGFAIALVILFTRFLTDFPALVGAATTFSEWGRMMMSRATSLPASFFFWSLLLYEGFAILFALFALLLGKRGMTSDGVRQQRLNPVFFGAWFFASLVLHSFASGRTSEQSVLVVLPLVLLAGLGLGDFLARFDASGFWSGRSWGKPVAILGLATGVVTTVGFVFRAIDHDSSTGTDIPTWLVIAVLVSIVLITIGSFGALSDSGNTGREVRVLDPVLMLAAAGLALFGVLTTSGLVFYRAADGSELLARQVPTGEARALIGRIDQVSRDLSVENRSNIDPTGRHGLNIAISPDEQWPFAWYFRDYHSMRVTPPAGWNQDVDVAIAPTAEAMDTWGLTPQQHTWRMRQPESHVDLDGGSILGRITQPSTWSDAVRYLISREIENPQEPETVTVGYSVRVANQLNPNFGPFDLFSADYPGPGTGQGQLNQPAGIGVSPDGEVIYVLNAGNRRIDRYERDGTFLGVWDAALDPALGLSWNVNQGATGLTVGPDGLVYIADTWNHTVIVLDESGTVVRQLGQRGNLTDITDEGVPSASPGLFFGPRGVAVTNERVFVTDTGNERVQVFSRDGTFLNAFGGFGSESGQFIEPTGIAIGPDGNVWVADSGNGRVQVFTIEGEFLEEILVPSWNGQMGIDRLNEVAVGPDGVVYLTSPAAGTIEVYDGRSLITLTNAPAVRAGGITVTPEGVLLITDVTGGTVIEVTPEFPEGFASSSDEGTPAASPVASPAATPSTP